MLRLVSASVNPNVPLRQWLDSWWKISMGLREAPRKRLMQPEKLTTLLTTH